MTWSGILHRGWPIIAAAALVTGAVIGWGYLTRHYREKGRAEVRQLWQADSQRRDLAEAASRLNWQRVMGELNQQYRSRETGQQARIQEIQLDHQKTRADLAAARAQLGSSLDRLRNILATQPGTPRPQLPASASGSGAAGQFDDTAATSRQLLGACAAELVELGTSAERHAAEVSGLQDYARAVTSANAPAP